MIRRTLAFAALALSLSACANGVDNNAFELTRWQDNLSKYAVAEETHWPAGEQSWFDWEHAEVALFDRRSERAQWRFTAHDDVLIRIGGSTVLAFGDSTVVPGLKDELPRSPDDHCILEAADHDYGQRVVRVDCGSRGKKTVKLPQTGWAKIYLSPTSMLAIHPDK